MIVMFPMFSFVVFRLHPTPRWSCRVVPPKVEGVRLKVRVVHLPVGVVLLPSTDVVLSKKTEVVEGVSGNGPDSHPAVSIQSPRFVSATARRSSSRRQTESDVNFDEYISDTS